MRRATSDRKKMPEDLEAFAAGDDDALWRRKQRHRLQDPRPVVLVPGVANRDARLVCEAREARIRQAVEADDRETLAVEMAEAARMRVWRGHSIVAWGAFVEAVLGLTLEEATQLRDEGAAIIGTAEAASDELVALWMRAEAGLVEAAGVGGAVRLEGSEGAERLVFQIGIEEAPDALANMGRRAAPLAREAADAPRSVVDRPAGVPRLSRLIERDLRGDDD